MRWRLIVHGAERLSDQIIGDHDPVPAEGDRLVVRRTEYVIVSRTYDYDRNLIRLDVERAS